jgi:hypothetical protein
VTSEGANVGVWKGWWSFKLINPVIALEESVNLKTGGGRKLTIVAAMIVVTCRMLRGRKMLIK